MSGKVIGWVHDADLPRGQKAVLAVLAGYLPNPGDGDPVCWPSVATVAARASITERHARKVLASLDRDGWIARTVNHGRNHTNRYTVDLDRLRAAKKTGHLGSVENRSSVTENRSFATENRSSVTGDLSRSVMESSSHGDGPEKTGHLPGVIVGMTDVTDDERREANRLLGRIPSHARPEPADYVLGLILEAHRRHGAGETWARLNPPHIDYSKVGPGAIVAALKKLATSAPTTRARSTTPTPEPAGERGHLGNPEAIATNLAALRDTLAAVKTNGRPSGAAAKKRNGAERIAAAADSPAFDAFKPRRARTS